MNRTLSVSAVIKKIMEINPDLTPPELAYIIRQSVQVQAPNEGFTKHEIVDAAAAIALAKATLTRN